MGTAESHKEPEKERETQKCREGRKERGCEVRWEKEEDWLLSAVSTLPAAHSPLINMQKKTSLMEFTE